METTYQIDRNNLMRDEDILLAINSRCQDPISDQNTIAEITWFGTDREIFLEVHIEPFNPKLMISHPEKYESIKIWSVPNSWDHFDGRPDGVEALKEVQKEGRRIYFALRRKTKIQLKRNLSQK